MYVVILAGGGGTRLWPLSSQDRPKPFLPLLGEETLFQRTVRRVGQVDVYCVADARYADLVRMQAPEVTFVPEPMARNTAPAIALAAAAIDRPDDEVMVVLPADHWIENEDLFRAVIRDAERELACGARGLGLSAPLVTLGVQPDRPATEYGYLRPDLGRRQRGALTAYVLEAFEEKPDAARAEALLREEGVAWNAGMFLWQRGAIRAALARYTDVIAPIEAAVAGGPAAVAAAYESVTRISIDYAVMEPAARDGQVVMGALDVGWNDLGSWTELLAALGLPGIEARVVTPGESVAVRAADLLVRRIGGRPVAVPGHEGTMAADDITAVLRGARPFKAQVDALLARCSGAQDA